jgi:phage baseplate assembly protein W
MNIDFPFRIGADGHTVAATDAKHVRDMIELLLFTYPGERVMQPSFGSGLLQYVFAPNSAELAATLQFTVQGGLHQWLGDLVDVVAVVVQSVDAQLSVEVDYVIRATSETRSETFTRSAT